MQAYNNCDNIPSLYIVFSVSPGLQEIIDAINNLEATAVAINDSASTYFDVTTNGVTYTVDTNTVTFDGAATCNAGQVVTNGFCGTVENKT